MAHKYRVIRTGNQYRPQYKRGWLSAWRFLQKDADESFTMRETAILTDDPDRAAWFSTAEDAHAFIERLEQNTKDYWAGYEAAKARARQSIRVDQVIPHKGNDR